MADLHTAAARIAHRVNRRTADADDEVQALLLNPNHETLKALQGALRDLGHKALASEIGDTFRRARKTAA